MDHGHIEAILQRLGLTPTEVSIFFAGLELGPSTVIQLANATKHQRITTHAVVQRLVEKGIFLETKNKKKRLVYPNDVSALRSLLDSKKQEISALERDLSKASHVLENLQARSQGFAKVRYYKGKEGVQLMIDEIIGDQQDMRVMCDARHFYDLIDNEFLERSLEMRQKKKLTTKMLFPMGFEYFSFSQGVYEQPLNIRSLPDHSPLIGALNIRGGKVGFHCQKDDFITTTIIEDPAIVQIMTYLFEGLWVGAKEY